VLSGFLPWLLAHLGAIGGARGRLGQVQVIKFDVDEVPLLDLPIALLRPVTIGVPMPIGPRRFTGDGEVAVSGTERLEHIGARWRLKILLGDKCDDLMTFIALGCGLSLAKVATEAARLPSQL
jgi:hypothetical protein